MTSFCSDSMIARHDVMTHYVMARYHAVAAKVPLLGSGFRGLLQKPRVLKKIINVLDF